MNRNVFSKLSKKKKRIVIVLMLFIVLDLALLTITSLPFTRAFFQSNANSSVDLDIAKFSFLVNGTINEEVSIDLNSTLDSNYTKVIPGSSGVIKLNLDASESEVNIRSVIKINRESIPNNLKIYKDAEHGVEINDSIVEIINYKEQKEVKLYWKWIFTEDNENNWMDKAISININVTGEQIINKEDEIPYEESILAYNIIKNAMKALPDTESTIYSPEPLTIPAQQISKENERTLSVTEDDYGNSYYFRGNVKDNYLNFNNMCWRVVRIEGDGSIKLILEDKTQICENTPGGDNAFIGEGQYGVKHATLNGVENVKVADYENCTSNKDNCMKTKFDDWFNKHLENVKDKLKYETWNLGDLETFYDSEGNIKDYSNNQLFFNTTMKVIYNKLPLTLTKSKNESTVKNYIATLSAEEAVLAGAKWNTSNINYYLYIPSSNWLLMSLFKIESNQIHPYFISKENLESKWYVGKGSLIETAPDSNANLRPSIVLKYGIEYISGNGTMEQPYEIK